MQAAQILEADLQPWACAFWSRIDQSVHPVRTWEAVRNTKSELATVLSELHPAVLDADLSLLTKIQACTASSSYLPAMRSCTQTSATGKQLLVDLADHCVIEFDSSNKIVTWADHIESLIEELAVLADAPLLVLQLNSSAAVPTDDQLAIAQQHLCSADASIRIASVELHGSSDAALLASTAECAAAAKVLRTVGTSVRGLSLVYLNCKERDPEEMYEEQHTCGLQLIASALMHMRSLRSLHLSHCYCAPPCDEQYIAQALLALTALTRLELPYFDALDCSQILRAVVRKPALQHLNMDAMALSRMPHNGAEYLVGLTALTYLSVRGTALEAYETGLICEHLPQLARLQHLDLSSCELPESGEEYLANSLSVVSHLQHLALYETGEFGDAGVQLLATRFSSVAGLTHLDLGWQHFGDAATMPTFAAHLTVLGTLCTLRLAWCRLAAAHMHELAPALATLTRLKQLHLSGNDLRVDGAAALAPALSALISLQDLDLSCCLLADDGVESIAPALSTLTELTSLQLSEWRKAGALSDQGAASLSSYGRGLTALVQLGLGGSSMSDEGKHALKSALAAASHLKWAEVWKTMW